MVWTVIWLMLLLIPIGGLCCIVWWAIRKTDEESAVSGGRRWRQHDPCALEPLPARATSALRAQVHDTTM